MTGLKAVTSADQILGLNDATKELVPVPEWGCAVWVRGLSGTERDSYEQSLLIGRGRKRDLNWLNARAKLLVRAIIDEDGNRIFTDSQAAELGTKNSAALDRLFTVARRLSGLAEEDIEELVEDLDKTQSADSSTT